MAVINRKRGYLFLAEPYCASRSIEEALLDHECSHRVDAWTHETAGKLADLGVLYPHEPLYKFSVIRHPADLLVTKYLHLTGWHKKGFKEFLRSHGNETLFLHANSADKTLRYEHLESHLNDLLQDKELPLVKLSVIGKTAGKRDWRSYYDADDLAFVSRLPDFRTYGYKL
jgi:hypothetical protein